MGQDLQANQHQHGHNEYKEQQLCPAPGLGRQVHNLGSRRGGGQAGGRRIDLAHKVLPRG
ncbi:MAG: hypothetical protein HPKKFMNG_01009 [Planctomycetes bacterium]|nr:hypothetical protein [Planctomycetota bacterium]